MPGLERKSPRLREYDYAACGAYLVTVCARDRACLFGRIVDDVIQLNRLGRTVGEYWFDIPVHFPAVATDALVVMPNHIHGIVWLARAGHAPPLPVVIGSFKAAASRTAGRPLWQRSFHDRVIRDESELQASRQYIADNPLRWAIDRENPFRP
jgi:REP-associated tyrosine transposase